MPWFRRQRMEVNVRRDTKEPWRVSALSRPDSNSFQPKNKTLSPQGARGFSLKFIVILRLTLKSTLTKSFRLFLLKCTHLPSTIAILHTNITLLAYLMYGLLEPSTESRFDIFNRFYCPFAVDVRVMQPNNKERFAGI